MPLHCKLHVNVFGNRNLTYSTSIRTCQCSVNASFAYVMSYVYLRMRWTIQRRCQSYISRVALAHIHKRHMLINPFNQILEKGLGNICTIRPSVRNDDFAIKWHTHKHTHPQITYLTCILGTLSTYLLEVFLTNDWYSNWCFMQNFASTRTPLTFIAGRMTLGTGTCRNRWIRAPHTAMRMCRDKAIVSA